MSPLFSAQNVESLDESQVSKYHWRVVVTAGMGFFTDAYDLFIIGVVTAILSPIWHLSTAQLALLNGASLLSAALGALFFGMLADRFGRKKLYGLEVFILFIGAILSAVSSSFMWLLWSRILVGFGIGGDYPSSAVIVSEHSGRKNRGFLVLLVFAMQAVGLVVGPLLASLLLATQLDPDWVWRILLGLGAIPAASVFYLRRTIKETPHFLKTQAAPYEVSRVISDLTGLTEALPPVVTYQKQSLLSKRWLKCLIGTAGAWFLLDIAFYGNGVSSVLILETLSPHASLLRHTLLSAGMFLLFAFPGYFLAAKYVDTIGRKPLQIFGFTIMMVCFGIIAFTPGITQQLPFFMAVFGLSFFFVNFGPNTTTFLIPAEIYPANIRAKAHGISAAAGKVGAFIGAFFLPPLLESHGLAFVIGLMGVVSFFGILITFLLPEMKHLSLDATETEAVYEH